MTRGVSTIRSTAMVWKNSTTQKSMVPLTGDALSGSGVHASGR